MTNEARKLLKYFLETPNDFEKHIRRFVHQDCTFKCSHTVCRDAGGVIMMAAYGHEGAFVHFTVGS